MKKLLFSISSLFLLLAPFGVSQPEPAATVPLSLVISYYAKPSDLVPLRDYMQGNGISQFAKWKNEGLLKDYRVLFAAYVDSDLPAMYVLLAFPNASASARWMDIEKSMPGGLSRDGLNLVTSAQTAQMDVISGNLSAEPATPGKSVFVVIPYEFYVSPSEYSKYMKGYGVPQFDGWLREKVISSYTVYVNRYSATKPWGSLIVFQYRDAEALGRRDAVMAKIRAQLQNDPGWKSISDNKHKIRNERQAFLGQELRSR